MELRVFTAGESHGKAILALLEGLPAGIPMPPEVINRDLARRQKGFGRGGRMRIERDEVEFLTGVRHGRTIGAPITLLIKNHDWVNWEKPMSSLPVDPDDIELDENGQPVDWRMRPITRPRPGHADLAAALKYNFKDIRDSLERSSARETTARTAAGAACKQLLRQLGIEIHSYVLQIGSARMTGFPPSPAVARDSDNPFDPAELARRAEESEVRCPDPEAEAAMIEAIKQAGKQGDTLGGIFEVVVTGLPVGLGAFAHWDRRLDGRIAGAVMSINAIKGVEIGLGMDVAGLPGSQVHDPIYFGTPPADRHVLQGPAGGYYRLTNGAGGVEAGITNGQPLVVRAAMKPIATLKRALPSVDMATQEPFEAHHERSDICAVPAAAVVGEAAVAIEVARSILDKFGGDSLGELQRNLSGYIDQLGRSGEGW